MKITDFYNIEYTQAALYANFRSIGCYIDGFKPSSRKVIYTIDKYNIKTKIKSSQLGSKVAEETQYLHGEQSLSGVISGLAKNFTGSNNINLLFPDGNFGSRFIQEPSSARYIYTKKSDWFDKMFDSRDKAILDNQEFEGEKIEYKYYMPVLPLILVNGSEGIGNGFAQKILPRSAYELQHQIRNRLKSTKYIFKPLKPHYNGFNGDIEKSDKPGTWNILGKFIPQGRTQIKITEIPIGYDLKQYLQILNSLVDEKVIKDYVDSSSDDNFEFILRVSRDFMDKNDEDIIEVLKLKKTLSENFTCTDENNTIIEFKDDVELLEKYIKIRLKYYTKRKKYLIEIYKHKKLVVENKIKFIKAIIEDSSIVAEKKKKDIIKWLEEGEYVKIDNSYDYLLRLPIYSLTYEKIKELEKELKMIKKDLTTVNSKTPKNMWLEDLTHINIE